MDGSYTKINYSLRPAKCIERKMLCSAFQKLSSFAPLETYRYIGFGSTYFSDFCLFHRDLGISNMVSIEKDEGNKERFEFNKPFACIELIFGESNKILPSIEWKTPTILWLDYDYKLDKSVLTDIHYFCSSAISGSLILVSVNATPEIPEEKLEPSDLNKFRLDTLIKRLGPEKVPPSINGADLAGWNFAKTCKRIISNEIKEVLTLRNGGLSIGEKMIFKQLFNFHYADGAKMLTVGGIIHQENHEEIYNKCEFNNLSFISNNNSPYFIEVPNLTYKELRYLNALLPTGSCDGLNGCTIVPKNDIEKYSKIYRYFPIFAETEQ